MVIFLALTLMYLYPQFTNKLLNLEIKKNYQKLRMYCMLLAPWCSEGDPDSAASASSGSVLERWPSRSRSGPRYQILHLSSALGDSQGHRVVKSQDHTCRWTALLQYTEC